ncbi:unnamed protein product [Arabidopsis lyrata]|nr:unnamed protein product [Arabidopsis lyrata]
MEFLQGNFVEHLVCIPKCFRRTLVYSGFVHREDYCNLHNCPPLRRSEIEYYAMLAKVGVHHYGIIAKKSYPKRLDAAWKAPMKGRSLHINCTLDSLARLKEKIGEDAYSQIRDQSKVGVLLKLADSSFVWWAKLVHHLLTHQLAISRPYEIWCLIEGSPIRFSLHEYEDITGLNCAEIDVEDIVAVDHREFWGDIKVAAEKGPNWNELESALKSCRSWSLEKRKMLGLLFVVHVGILGISRSSRIPLDYAKRVLDTEAFERFPWGRVGFKELITSIKVLSYDRTSYAIHGCPHVLNIWAFDSIPHLVKSHGNQVPDDGDGDEDEPEPVPLLQWNGGRPRICLKNFFETEKLRKKKIKVQHLVVRPVEEIYPVWPGENAVYGEGVGANKLVDNLLHDIINGGLKESGFGDPEIGKKTGKRKKEVDSEDDFVDPPKKRKAETEKRIKKIGNSGKQLRDVSDDSGEEVLEKQGMERLFKMIGSLSEEMKTLNTNFVAGLEKVDLKCEGLKKSVTDLQDDVEKLRNKAEEKNDEIEEDSANGSEEGTGTNSEIIELRLFSHGISRRSRQGYPISVVVRREKEKGKGKRKAGSKKSKTTECVDPTKTSKKLFMEEDSGSMSPLVKDPKGGLMRDSVIHNLIGETSSPAKQFKPFSEADWDRRDTGSTAGVMTKSMLHKKNTSPLGRCIKKEPPSPKKSKLTHLSEKKKTKPDLVSEWSHSEENDKEKNSTAGLDKLVVSVVKKIMLIVHVAYDPFEPVSPEKMDKLEKFIDHDLDNPLDSTNSSAMFYMKIKIPKEHWPEGEPEYGWLTDVWAVDYIKFDKDSNWKFTDKDIDVYNGESPPNGKTYKKWVKDIDILYLTTLGKIIGQFTRMIPALIQAMEHVEERKKLGASAFSIYRVKTAPQNFQTGDCGVYSVKFIECLAIGISFEGLCDSAMPGIRLKLATELFDEVPDSDCFIQIKDPLGVDTVGVEFISQNDPS